MPLLLLLGSGVLGAARESHIGGDVVWTTDMASALQQARREHKPLLLEFHTTDCGWCAKMDAETFTDPQVVELTRHFVCVRLESDTDAALAARYSVMDYPMTLLTDPEAHPRLRLPGFLAPREIVPSLRAALHLPSTGR